jgi:hypothetical protein
MADFLKLPAAIAILFLLLKCIIPISISCKALGEMSLLSYELPDYVKHGKQYIFVKKNQDCFNQSKGEGGLPSSMLGKISIILFMWYLLRMWLGSVRSREDPQSAKGSFWLWYSFLPGDAVRSCGISECAQ